MAIDIDRELILLHRLSAAQLRKRYRDTFGEAVRTGNKTWLIKRLGWRLQALAEGDLSERARQRAVELARDADLRLSPPRQGKFAATATLLDNASAKASVVPAAVPDPRLPPPGSLLTRSYKGQTIEVKVLTEGFAYQGQVFASLSAVAKEITGSHCSGFWFFRLGRPVPGAKT